MIKNFKPLLLLLLTISFSIHLTAQNIESKRNGVIKHIKYNQGEQPNLQEAQNILQEKLKMTSADRLVFTKKTDDNLGFSHEKYQQYHKGLKVEFGTFIVHAKNNRIQTMNGDFFPVKSVKTTPTLSEEQALNLALQHINADSYMWESEENEQYAAANEPAGTYKPTGELVIVKQFNTKDKLTDLAYKFDIYADQPISRDHIYVNAHTGEIVFKNAIIKHCFHAEGEHNHSCSSAHDHDNPALDEAVNTMTAFLATGTAATRYSGSRSIETSTTSGGHRLRETTRGSGINTYDCNTGTNYGSAVDFVDNDNNWTAAEWNNSAKDNAAFDAHWGAEMTYDYFIQQHNRSSYDGNGAAINSYVHYNSNYDNAFWDGSRMTYGDGNTFDALTSLDVAAHEIGHGVCSYTANLVYSYESGALNEAFSDIWAACVEDLMVPGEKQPYLIGEDIGPGGSPLRNMINPNAEGQPDTYLGTSWYSGSGDNGGVHYNSGVLNHCFYIASVGESGTNDNGDSYAVPGIGIVKAGKIFYRAESVYLSSNSQYADARTACIQSAEDLYGASSSEVCTITNAFYAVGVGASSTCAAPACDDGIQNGDETGIDCGGSCANACPTCDDNIQNGDEEGIDCGGSFCAACPCLANEVNINFTFDNYPEETSWSLTSGGTTVASGGTYGSQADGSTLTISECLTDGCYDFTINDAYGDGICCSYGNGSYSVTDSDGNVLASGASFTSSETTNICVTGTPTVPGCTDASAHNYDSNATQDDGSCETCSDMVMNGDETGVDCGGALCAVCPPDPIPGCTDPSAHNYDSNATQDDGSCETCSDMVMNGDETGVDCGGALCAVCPPDPIPGCTDASAHNYDSNATQDDGSCETCSDMVMNGDETGVDCGGALCAVCPPDPIPGCTDASAHNYDSNATQDDGSCETCSDSVMNGDETGVDCGGALCAPCSTGCSTVTIDSNNFDSGWGIWNDGGSDCRRSANDANYANSGSYCVRLRDNTSTSTMTTDALDLSSFEEITIAYSMYARSMENNEDYFIEVNTGSGWVAVANYARGVHFNNNTRYNDAVTVTGPFSASTNIRFRNDASGNSDWVYIDDVNITGCSNASVNSAVGTMVNTFGGDDIKTEIEVKDISMNIFPNPTRDVLNVSIDAEDNKEVQISIYNQLGQLILTQNADNTVKNIELQVGNLTPGNYFISVQIDGERFVEKFVKY